MIDAGAYGAFALGFSTSIGPCAVPRYLALAGALGEPSSPRRALDGVLFVGGLAASYAGLASLGIVYAAVLSLSHVLYLGLGIAFCAGGLGMAVSRRCPEVRHAHHPGQPLLSGAACGFVVSPCCTPIVLQGGLMASSGSGWNAVVWLSAFLLGHLAPTAIAALWGGAAFSRLRAGAVAEAMPTVAAGCTVALGLYYGVSA